MLNTNLLFFFFNFLLLGVKEQIDRLSPLQELFQNYVYHTIMYGQQDWLDVQCFY